MHRPDRGPRVSEEDFSKHFRQRLGEKAWPVFLAMFRRADAEGKSWEFFQNILNMSKLDIF